MLRLISALFPWVALAFILAGSFYRVFDVYEYQTYDWRFKIKPRLPVSDRIVLIEIGDDTLSTLGEWPIPRRYYADLVNILHAHGARMIGFDMLFSESREGDEELAQAMKNAGNVYLAKAFMDPRSEHRRLVSQSSQTLIVPVMNGAVEGEGTVNMAVDEDGKRRRVAPGVFSDDGFHLQLALLMAADDLGVPRESVRHTGDELQFGDYAALPLDDRGYFLVHYAGKWVETFHHVSFVDILSSQFQTETGGKPALDLDFFKDKVCFLGLTATATHDVNPVPLEPIYSQLGVHANVFNSVLQKKFLLRLGRPWNLIILVLLAILAVSLPRIPGLFWSISSALFTILAFAAASVLLFSIFLVWIDLFYPAAIFGLIYLLGVTKRTMAEKQKRELIEADLAIASNIQRSFLPSVLPECPYAEMSVFMKPAKHVGGDLYSIFKIDEDRLAVMLGDVSGKGTPAALFMAKSVSEFKYQARGHADPAQVLAGLNDSLSAEETSSGLFVTMTFAVFSFRERKMILSNGGHLPVLRIKPGGAAEFLSPEGGMPLSLMPGVEYGNLEVPIEEGDLIGFYSDGISEAKNMKRQDFDMERLEASLRKRPNLTVKETQKQVLEDISRFVGRAPQHDDMTLILVKILKLP